MTTTNLLKQLEQWHEQGKHDKIAEILLTMPENERDYKLTSLLARALNNLSRYEEALSLLESIQAQGQDDPYWHFRMGYSLYYIDGREVESISYLERAIELGDDYPSTYELLLEAKKYREAAQQMDAEDAENQDEVSFVPRGHVSLSLNMRLQPQHRTRIEDALDSMFRAKGWGYVSGGGTSTSSEGEPESCDIEIDIMEDSEEMLQNLLSVAQKLEAAKGSELKYRSDEKKSRNLEYDVKYPTGGLEGIAVYIDKTDLSAEAYQDYYTNIGQAFEMLLEILTGNGALIYSYWEGSKELAFYFYGEGDAEDMLAKVLPFLKEHPLCQKYRTVRIA